MPTIINNPTSGTTSDDSGVGVILGVLLGIVLVALFFVYGLPILRENLARPENEPSTTNINVTLPPIVDTTPKQNQ